MGNTNRLLAAAAVMTLAAQAGVASAATYTWTGGGGANANWSTTGNWNPAADPTSNADVARLTGTPTVQQPVVNRAATTANTAPAQPNTSLLFESARWTIGPGTDLTTYAIGEQVNTKLRPSGVTSGGAGVNVLAAGMDLRSLPTTGATAGFNVLAGNCLLLNASNRSSQRTDIQLRTNTFSVPIFKSGAGTLVVSDVENSPTKGSGAGFHVQEAGTLLDDVSYNPNGRADWIVSGTGTLGGTGTINLGFTNNDTTGTTADDYARDLTLRTGGRLSPGGAGTSIGRITGDDSSTAFNFGNAIGPLTVNGNGGNSTLASANGTAAADVMQAGSILAIDLGSAGGVSDRPVITGEGTNILNLTADNTLALFGPTSLAAGDTYTIATFDSSAGYGTFENVTFNGLSAAVCSTSPTTRPESS